MSATDETRESPEDFDRWWTQELLIENGIGGEKRQKKIGKPPVTRTTTLWDKERHLRGKQRAKSMQGPGGRFVKRGRR